MMNILELQESHIYAELEWRFWSHQFNGNESINLVKYKMVNNDAKIIGFDYYLMILY